MLPIIFRPGSISDEGNAAELRIMSPESGRAGYLLLSIILPRDLCPERVLPTHELQRIMITLEVEGKYLARI
jgi:hypothetical protein